MNDFVRNVGHVHFRSETSATPRKVDSTVFPFRTIDLFLIIPTTTTGRGVRKRQETKHSSELDFETKTTVN